jgi:hypothetical protein
MSADKTFSRNGVAIRLTDERWQHIMEEHAELAGMRDDVLRAVTDAERVLSGTEGELLPFECWNRIRHLWLFIVRSTSATDSSSLRS